MENLLKITTKLGKKSTLLQPNHLSTFYFKKIPDLLWLQDMLLDREKKEKLNQYKIFFPDSGKIWRYVDDFAFISSCNHTVILRYFDRLIWISVSPQSFCNFCKGHISPGGWDTLHSSEDIVSYPISSRASQVTWINNQGRTERMKLIGFNIVFSSMYVNLGVLFMYLMCTQYLLVLFSFRQPSVSGFVASISCLCLISDQLLRS